MHRVLDGGGGGAFARIARRPGFPHAMARTFQELRAARLAGASRRALADTSPDLLALVTAMETELDRMKVVDRALVFEIATGALGEGPGRESERPVLLLDLALADELERRLIASLATGARRVFATAAEGDRTAIDMLERTLSAPATLVGGEDSSSLERLQKHLFQESAPQPRALDASVALASWPGEARECVEIARGLQTQAAQGIPFERMAI
ncbi:MAG TPA: hypothetical protein VMS45_03905, partial [Gemmatimonadaceae bacterium]|nr:hypothetical protein [Gemmatimonadaceae bacterium]